MVYLFDLFPTLCDASGLPSPNGVDGKDLLPVIKGKQSSVRNSLYTAYRNTVRAVRTDEWKLIRYPQRNFTQLFNLKRDPLEINNLAMAPEYQSTTAEMMNLLKDWYRATDDTANLSPDKFLPLNYDHTKLKQKADQWQPEYTLKKYFNGATIGK